MNQLSLGSMRHGVWLRWLLYSAAAIGAFIVVPKVAAMQSAGLPPSPSDWATTLMSTASSSENPAAQIGSWHGAIAVPSETIAPFDGLEIASANAGGLTCDHDLSDGFTIELNSREEPLRDALISGCSGRYVMGHAFAPDALCGAKAPISGDWVYCRTLPEAYQSAEAFVDQAATAAPLWVEHNKSEGTRWSWNINWYDPGEDMTFTVILTRDQDLFGAPKLDKANAQFVSQMLQLMSSFTIVHLESPRNDSATVSCALSELLPHRFADAVGNEGTLTISCNSSTSGYIAEIKVPFATEAYALWTMTAREWLSGHGVPSDTPIEYRGVCIDEPAGTPLVAQDQCR